MSYNKNNLSFWPRIFRKSGSGRFRLKKLSLITRREIKYNPLGGEFICDKSMDRYCCAIRSSISAKDDFKFPDRPHWPESYRLLASDGKITVSAADSRGLRYALGFLADCQMEKIELAEGFYEDYPAMKIRGVMVDVARVTESIDTLCELAHFISKYRANMLMLYLEGKFPLKKHPALKRVDTYKLGQIKKLHKLTKALDIELVPSFSLFGHATYILRNEGYAHLSDGPQSYQLNPLLRQTKHLCSDHFDSWNSTVHSKFVHTGCDETPYMGLCSQTAKFITKHGKAEFFARHIRFMHAQLSKNAQRMMIWGDMLRHYPEIAEKIPKDIIICDWNYGKITDQWADGFQRLKKLGFDIICVPAAARSAEMFLPDEVHHNKNIAPFVKLGLSENALGCIISSWESYTIFPKLIWPGYALGLSLAWSGKTGAKNVRTARENAYESVFGHNARTAIEAINTVGGHVMVKQMRKRHFDTAIKDKTYHLVTHEVLPTDPMLYANSPKGRPGNILTNTMRNKSIELAEKIIGRDPAGQLLKQSLLWTRLIAEIRLLPQNAFKQLQKACKHWGKSDHSSCKKYLKNAISDFQQLKKLSAQALKKSRRQWDNFRLSDDPLYERFHGLRRNWSVKGCQIWLRYLKKSLTDLEHKRIPSVFAYYQSRKVILCRLGIAANEVNILCMNLECVDNEENWKNECHIEAFQLPGSDYCYSYMPLQSPSKLKFTITRTQTPWDFSNLSVEVYKLPKLYGKGRIDFKCDDYILGKKIRTLRPAQTDKKCCIIELL